MPKVLKMSSSRAIRIAEAGPLANIEIRYIPRAVHKGLATLAYIQLYVCSLLSVDY